MSLHAALADACAAVGIATPGRTKPGEWVRCQVRGKSQSNRSGAVLVFDDQRGGIAHNWVTGEQQRFTVEGLAGANEAKAPRRDMEAERKRQQEQAEAARICGEIVKACRVGAHPYLARKGFPDEVGLVIDDPRPVIPAHDLGQAVVARLPKGAGPWLIVPGRIAHRVTTLQFIDAEGGKKNTYRGAMRGAAHRIATGRETWVCEGIATALTVRAALRLLGRSATVLSAFSAANVAQVAQRHAGSIIAADHDAPQEALHGRGAGEFYARKTGHVWTQPPTVEDFNDLHQREGLRAVALLLKGVRPP